MDYTIIGGEVNLASRLESLAQEDSILVSYETYALIKDQIKCEERQQTNVKGIAYPVRVFDVIDTYVNLDAGAAAKGRHEVISERQQGFRLELDLQQADTAYVRSRLQAVIKSH